MRYPRKYTHFFSVIRVIALISIPALSVQAQLIDEQRMNQENFLSRVGDIESFINRFNREEDEKGNPINHLPSKSKEAFIKERTYSILSLFDIESANRTVGEDKNNIIAFVNQVNDDQHQTKLDFYDTDWYAEIECNAQFKKQQKKVTLILNNQQMSTAGSKWVIQSAYADFLRLKPVTHQNGSFIPPNSHGTGFIGLSDALADAKEILRYTPRDYKPDAFSLFLYAVYNQDLILQETTHVCFHFMQIDGWIVQVKEYNRNKPNAGWLISKLIKADATTKASYRKDLFTGQKKQ